MSKDIVLAFSGGLDTSFCVPYLKERGWAVHTLVRRHRRRGRRGTRVHRAARQATRRRLSTSPSTADRRIWEHFVKPFVWAGEGYQGQYPLLVSDRYLIVERRSSAAPSSASRAIAHGCTGMGNDQVRFDLAVKAQGDYEIVAPIREIQKEHTQTRAYEQKYLEERGFGVRAKQRAYTINENLLGVTMSGGEIDDWQAPGEGARGWCKPRAEWPSKPLSVKLTFVAGEAVALDGATIAGHELLAKLNALFARLRRRPRHSTPATPPSASRAASCSRRRA